MYFVLLFFFLFIYKLEWDLGLVVFYMLEIVMVVIVSGYCIECVLILEKRRLDLNFFNMFIICMFLEM